MIPCGIIGRKTCWTASVTKVAFSDLRVPKFSWGSMPPDPPILFTLKHIQWLYQSKSAGSGPENVMSTATNSGVPTVLVAAVRATNECPDCATWGRWKGDGPYNKLSSERQVETCLWYTSRNVLTGFTLCIIYLVSTSTGMDSISLVKLLATKT